jgi:hypothetical protein
MLKDIPSHQVKDIAIAIVKEENELNETIWNVYLINLKVNSIEGVLVSSKGYGDRDGESIKTSTLRHVLPDLPPNSFARIEPIMEEVFGLTNEYWISFYEGNILYDKKYIFLAESVTDSNLTTIPVIGKKGVMIK